jgi:hypothetical protein
LENERTGSNVSYKQKKKEDSMKKILLTLCVMALTIALSAPAFAAEWSLYGSSRISTFWETSSKEVTGTGNSDTELVMNQQGNARIGARVKSGEISGRFEYGGTVNMRLLYGQWKWFRVGQDYTPLTFFTSDMVRGGDEGLIFSGVLYNSRQPQLKALFGGLEASLIVPNAPAIAAAGDQTNAVIPKIAAKYTLKLGSASIGAMGGFNTYEVENTTTDKTYDITSYVGGVFTTIGAGPVTIKANVYYGVNTGNYGITNYGVDDAGFNPVKDEIEDVNTLGYALTASLMAGQTIKLQAGVGGNQHDSDASGSKTDDAIVYYVQAKIDVAKGFFIVPEVGFIDFGKDSTDADEGDITYFGAKWQMNF